MNDWVEFMRVTHSLVLAFAIGVSLFGGPTMGRAAKSESPASAPPHLASPPRGEGSECPTDIAQSLVVSPNAQLVLSRPTQAVPRLCELELTVVAKVEVKNPYDPNEMDMRVRFTSSSGKSVTVPAFYFAHPQDNGKRGWRARFTPTVAGRWSAVVDATTKDGHTRSQRIVFTVSPRSAQGFVRVSKANPRYLAFDTGKTFYPIGLNLGWWRDDALRDYTRWLDALQANGGTVARVWLAPWSFGLEWIDTGLGNYDRQVRAFWLDEVLHMAERRGIYLVLGLIPDRDFIEGASWTDNPYNIANGGPLRTPQEFATNPVAREYFKRYLRYVVARWGYSPNVLAWEYWNEVESTRIETPSLKPWIEDVASVLREFDVNHHLTTISYVGNGDDDIWRMPEIDLMQRHEYNESPKWFGFVPGGVRLSPNAPAKPLLFGEFGFSSAGEKINPATQDGIHLHNSLWASAFGGFASSAMYWWWDDYVGVGNLWHQFKGLSRFVADEDLATLAPVSATVALPDAKPSIMPRAVALAMANKTHALIWLRNGQYNQSDVSARYLISQSTGEAFVIKLDELRGVTVSFAGLADGAYRVTWFDTQTGEPVATETTMVREGRTTVTAPPFARDVAAKISR